MLLLTLTTAAQSKHKGWWMDRDSVAHGPANDVFKWAGYRATVNEQNRTKTTLYWLVAKELQLANKEIAAQDSSIAEKDTLIAWQQDRILFLSDRVRKLENRKPRRLVWLGVGYMLGFATPRKQED